MRRILAISSRKQRNDGRLAEWVLRNKNPFPEYAPLNMYRTLLLTEIYLA